MYINYYTMNIYLNMDIYSQMEYFAEACKKRDIIRINLIIEAGVREWNYGLLGACQGGHLDLINLMISKGANRWNWGLEAACYGGQFEIVKLMISKGADNFHYLRNTDNLKIYLIYCKHVITYDRNKLIELLKEQSYVYTMLVIQKHSLFRDFPVDIMKIINKFL
jgi:hypothetical protein